MIKLFDTHAHLQFEKFDSDRDIVVKRNSEKLLALINPGTDIGSSEKAIALAQRVTNFYAAIGVHPHHVDNWDKTYLPKLESLVQKNKVVAVGEIGLDKHVYVGYPKPDIKKQLAILVPQIELAKKYKKPILFHCRNAYDQLYTAIKDYKPLQGLVHCFMGELETAQKFIDSGLLISFAGNLTYKNNEHITRTATLLSQDKILIETDSPYLTPEPLRGQRNEPVNVLLIAEKIAQLKNLSLEQVSYFTSANAKKLFNL